MSLGVVDISVDFFEFRQLRESAGLTQADLGKYLGLSRVFVGLMERGARPIARRTAEAMKAIPPRALDLRSQETDPDLRNFENSLMQLGIEFSATHDIESDTAHYQLHQPRLQFAFNRTLSPISLKDSDMTAGFVAIRSVEALRFITDLIANAVRAPKS